jgi:hypothetical protein
MKWVVVCKCACAETPRDQAQRLVAKDGDQQSLCSWSRTQLQQLEKCMIRYAVDKRYKFLYFKALCYVKEGEICIVTGPIEDPRIIDDESLRYVPGEISYYL